MKKKIKIYNKTTGHVTYVNSIFEAPIGYEEDSHHFTATQKKHLSQAAKARGAPECAYRDKSGENNPMYGKHQSEEAKQKIKENMKTIKGKRAYHNEANEQIFIEDGAEVPAGFVLGGKKRVGNVK